MWIWILVEGLKLCGFLLCSLTITSWLRQVLTKRKQTLATSIGWIEFNSCLTYTFGKWFLLLIPDLILSFQFDLCWCWYLIPLNSCHQVGLIRAGTLLWEYRQYIWMPYIALPSAGLDTLPYIGCTNISGSHILHFLGRPGYIAIYWTHSVDLDPSRELWD